MSYNLAQLQSLFRQAGWPENLIEKASAVSMYESSGNAYAHNPSSEDSWGLMQINWPYHQEYNRGRLVEPIYNLQAAYAIYRREGWNAWYNSNIKYQNNLNGIARQARNIYQNGGQYINATVTDMLTATSDAYSDIESDNSVLYIAIGIAAVWLFT